MDETIKEILFFSINLSIDWHLDFKTSKLSINKFFPPLGILNNYYFQN